MRRKFNDGMEVVYQDFDAMGALVERTLYDRVIYEMLQKAENAFFSTGFLTSYVSPTSVSVGAGVGFQTDNTQVNPEPTKRLLYRATATTLNLTAPDLVNPRIDIVVCKHNRADTDIETRKFKNASTSVVTNESFTVETDWLSDLSIVAGTPAGSPVAPATPSGYIKIATLQVAAVTGMSGSGDVADNRNAMPVGGGITINSLAFVVLTQSAALSIQAAMAEVDGYLRDGKARQNDWVDRVTDPAVPAASNLRMYNKGGVMFTRDNAGNVTPLGAGGSGGGGAEWVGSAVEDYEYNQKVKLFSIGAGQTETLFIKIPQSYLTGRQIKMYLGLYSPSATNNWKVQAVTSLVRVGQDAVNSVTNQNTSNSGDITNDNALEFRQVVLDLNTALGQINGFAVSVGDLLRVELSRITPGGTEDTADLRMIPSTTEVKVG